MTPIFVLFLSLFLSTILFKRVAQDPWPLTAAAGMRIGSREVHQPSSELQGCSGGGGSGVGAAGRGTSQHHHQQHQQHQQQLIHVRVVVPATAAGAIIGKQGENINALKVMTLMLVMTTTAIMIRMTMMVSSM